MILLLVLMFFNIQPTQAAETKLDIPEMPYKCFLEDYWLAKEFSQGYVAPIRRERSTNFNKDGSIAYVGSDHVILDGKGLLHKPGKYDIIVNLGVKNQNITKIASTAVELSEKEDNYYQAVAIDNTLYVIKGVIEYFLAGACYGKQYRKGRVEYIREFNSLIKGTPLVFDDEKLAVLTINNELNIINMQTGFTIWSQQNGGAAEIKPGYRSSPVFFYDSPFDDNSKKILIAALANGELVAFDGNGKKRWSYQFAHKKSQPTYIVTSPQIHGEIVIAISNHQIVGLEVKSGKLLWSKAMHIRNAAGFNLTISEKEFLEASVVITENNEAIAINAHNGKILWQTNLPLENYRTNYDNLYYPAPNMQKLYPKEVFIITNKGIMFLLNQSSGKVEKIVRIPQEIYHPMSFLNPTDPYHGYFTTEKQGLYHCEGWS